MRRPEATATVAPAAGVQGEVITYSGAAPGVEVIATAGNGVYALRELQTAGGAPISANTVTALLGVADQPLISRRVAPSPASVAELGATAYDELTQLLVDA